MRKALEHFFIRFLLEEDLDKAMAFFVKKLVRNLLVNNVVVSLNGVALENYIDIGKYESRGELIENIINPNKEPIDSAIYTLVPLVLRTNVNLYDLFSDKVFYFLALCRLECRARGTSASIPNMSVCEMTACVSQMTP
eukprot:TRINITY_DN5337_c0_g1_i1.p1 TRINITY_DN5337_c0_g1~~TRINITY_DN5337_c0_g1_i1.p1  ORF type:complete len:138 (+),score=15.01 TRINITY_DN5337_c0_g1_i1:669-1082(+)